MHIAMVTTPVTFLQGFIEFQGIVNKKLILYLKCKMNKKMASNYPTQTLEDTILFLLHINIVR